MSCKFCEEKEEDRSQAKRPSQLQVLLRPCVPDLPGPALDDRPESSKPKGPFGCAAVGSQSCPAGVPSLAVLPTSGYGMGRLSHACPTSYLGEHGSSASQAHSRERFCLRWIMLPSPLPGLGEVPMKSWTSELMLK